MISEKNKIKNILSATNPVKEYFKEENFLLRSNCMLFDANFTAFQNLFAEINYDGYQVVGLANYEKMALLNNESIKYTQDIFPTEIAHCINFDSNIVSDIYRLFCGKEVANKDSLLKFLIAIKKTGAQTSAIPYILECSYNKKIIDKNIVYQNILFFFLYTRLSLKQLQEEHGSVSPSVEDYVSADRVWNEINSDFNKELFVSYLGIYCMLCKSYLIKMSRGKTFDCKVKELIDFMDNNLYCYLEFEFVLCCWFFRNDSRLSYFFRQMQPNSRNVVNTIKNMTWDIIHIRNIQAEMAHRNTNDKVDKFFIHSFASHDKGLIDIIKSNPINRLILYKNEAYPKYKVSFEDICKDLDVYSSFLQNTFIREEFCKVNQTCYFKELAFKLESAIYNLE